jgi:hypothetical protein
MPRLTLAQSNFVLPNSVLIKKKSRSIMIKNLLPILAFFFVGIQTGFSQTILDFETLATSASFQYFGSTIDGQTTQVIANPNPTGINTSAKVLEFKEPLGAMVWAGAYSNPVPTSPVNLLSGGVIKIKFHTSHAGNLLLKLEEGQNGAPNWALQVENTVVNEWVELTFDPAKPSVEGPNLPATGAIYNKIVLFADFGSVPTVDYTYYIDDVKVAPQEVCTTIFDYETAATSTTFQFFGSTLEGSLSSAIANPNPTGINTSAKVLEFKETAGAMVWAGAFSNPVPTTPVNLLSGGLIKVKFHTNHPGNLVVKLEDGQNGAPNWALQVNTTVVNEWVELVFDPNLPSIEGPNLPATGAIYNKIVLFADFGTVPTVDQTFYLDDFKVCSAGGIPTADVTFKLDMNQFAGAAFTKAYVSGTFNNFSGDANPLTDVDGDKIYETKINMPVGLYEYKFTLDNWAQQELFDPTTTCTKTTIDGANVFVNRKLVVSQTATEGPVCFNSCYSCGNSVKITVNLGMNGVVPDPGGVYIAGGLDFANPGGRFKMTDPDGDGVFSIKVERQKGYTAYYAFANGACPDYSCKEDIAGLSCAIAANFNDRQMQPVTKDTVINTCFALCSTNTNCTSGTSNLELSGDWMTVQPTLASDFVKINFATPILGKAEVRVFDAAGQLVILNTKNDVSEYVLPIDGLQNGLFFILVKTENKAAMARFVKM